MAEEKKEQQYLKKIIQAVADDRYEALKPDISVALLGSASDAFSKGTVIATEHLAKVLEFDAVIVPGCSSKNYKNETDRQMLYVACTRAMHRLGITCMGKKTVYL